MTPCIKDTRLKSNKGNDGTVKITIFCVSKLNLEINFSMEFFVTPESIKKNLEFCQF